MEPKISLQHNSAQQAPLSLLPGNVSLPFQFVLFIRLMNTLSLPWDYDIQENQDRNVYPPIMKPFLFSQEGILDKEQPGPALSGDHRLQTLTADKKNEEDRRAHWQEVSPLSRSSASLIQAIFQTYSLKCTSHLVTALLGIIATGTSMTQLPIAYVSMVQCIFLEGLFGGSSRRAHLLFTGDRMVLPQQGRLSSSTEQSASGKMDMEGCGRKGNTRRLCRAAESTPGINEMPDTAVISPSHPNMPFWKKTCSVRCYREFII